MYFPIGWPRYLSGGQGKKSNLKCVVCNRYRMLFAVLTETTVSIWHCKPCVEIVSYQRCHSSVASIGTNELAEWRQDSSMLAVTTTEGYLLIYQLEQDVKGDKGLNLYEYHQTKTNQGDANEVVPALRLTLKSNVNYKVPVTSLSCVHDELLVGLVDGRLEILSWENATEQRKSVALCDIPFSMDLNLAGTIIKERNVFPIQAVYSPFLEGFALVLSDGRVALVAMTQSAPGSPDSEDGEVIESGWKTRGIWAPGVSNATSVAVNNKYRLLAFGTTVGDCKVFAIDDTTGSLTLSHTISLSPTQYPNICKTVGAVMKMDWSPDGCVLALAWMKGGLSVWSVFGSCLFCTLASDRAHGSDGAPNVQGTFRSLCWGVEGYSLWLVGTHTNPKKNAKTQAETQNDTENKSSTDKQKKGHRKSARRKLVAENGADVAPSTGKSNLDLAQLLIIQFVKSALAMNPCMSNHCHVLMHSEDKIFVSLGERPQTYSIVSSDTTDRSFLARRDSTLQSTYSEITSPGIRTMQGTRGSPRRRSVPTPLASPQRVSQSQAPTLSRIDQSGTATSQSRADDGDDDEEDISCHLGSAVTNKQWTVIQFPLNYLPGNWPIRFTAVDDTGCFLAIAGNFGLAHYTVTSRKWKVFGNVMQEKDMVVTGGLTWWEDYVVVACYNLSENQDEVRLYPRLTNLDNSFACIRRVKSQILLVNIFQNLLILFTYDCRISIFVLAHDPKQPREAATIRFLQELSMARYVPYPTLVASVTLTALHLESALRRSSSSASFSSRPQRETEVLIVNVAGRLLLLQGATDDEETPSGVTTDLEEPVAPLANERRQLRFTAPVVLASCVENIWTTQHKNRAKVHLTDALWLGCGGAGVRVWLPLFPPRHNRHGGEDGSGHRGFELQLLTARRITLAFALDSCYPLAVLFNEAVVLGVTSETLQGFDETLTHKKLLEYNTALQFSTIERTCEIYLHQILRQLLRRNLGYHALQLAATCQNLSCFPHVLELMLHEVLEEEATASEPIPDPLLPTVIKFLEEFPQYLQTVVHCARKTEIALWEYLFNSVGSPRELFEECLELGQLRTAASYLIILQNLELLAVARQDATRLFDQALHTQQWVLANEIARFLRAIGDGDACATPRHPTLLNANIYPTVTPGSHHNTPTEPDPAFKFSEERKTLMMRQYSVVPGLDTHNSLHHQRRSSSKSAPPTPQPQAHSNVYSSASKAPQINPVSPEDPQAPAAPPNSRRLTSRSYTESYFDLVPPAGTVTSPGGQSSSGGSSLSHPYVVGKYQTRQYHQDHHPMHRPLQHSTSHPTSATGAMRSKRFSGDKDSVSKEQTAAECAEHYFLDVILARQARKILSERRIHDLGTFAACVDFQLVPWLRKERSRACRVDDAVACLQSLHSDFAWPLPTFFSTRSSRGSTASSGGTPSHSRSFHDLGSLQSRLGAIDVNTNSMSPSRSAHFNTSPRSRQSALRYPNAPGLSPKRHNAVASLDVASVGTDEDGGAGSGVLTVLSARETGSTLTLTTLASEMSEVSESSLNVEDSSFGATSEDVYGFIGNGINLDDKRGPPRCEMKLQYLLELFLEALCLEWATLVCLMLRDPSNMARLVRSARLADPVTSADVDTVPLESLQRTRDCLSQIDQWALKECPGYKAVLVSVRAHLQELYDVINAREIAHAEQQAFVAQQQLQSHGSAQNPSNNTSSSGVNTTSHTSPVSVVPNITIDRSAWSNVAPSTTPTPPLANKSTVPVNKKRLPAPGSAQNLASAPPSLHNGTEGSASSSSDQDDDQSSVVTSLSRHEPQESHDVTRTTVAASQQSPALLNQVDGDLAPHFPPAPVAESMSGEAEFQDGGEENSELESDSEMYDSEEYTESQDEGTGCSVS